MEDKNYWRELKDFDVDGAGAIDKVTTHLSMNKCKI